MITRTFNTRLIREILSDPELNRRVTKDGDVMAFDPENQPELIYLLATEGEKVLGFLLLHSFNSPICFQIHANYLSNCWGHGLDKYTKKAIEWMFKNTDARKIIALCPDKYPAAKHHALKVGFSIEGLLTKSSLFDGELYDNTIMGISK